MMYRLEMKKQREGLISMTIYEVTQSTTGGSEACTSDHGSDCFALVELMLMMQESPSGISGTTASLSRNAAALQNSLI